MQQITNKERALARKEHKVINSGDSHARGCVAELTLNLRGNFEVTGFVKPGTRFQVIRNMGNEEIDKLTTKDVPFF